MAKSKSTRTGGANLEQQKAFLESALNSGNLTVEKTKEYEAALDRINKILSKQTVLQEAALTNMTEMSDSVKSLGQYIGKNNKLFETMNTLTDGMNTSLDSVSQMLRVKVLSGATKFKKEVFKTAEAYKSLGNVIAVNTKKLAKQQITTSQYNESIIDSFEDLEEQIDRVTASMESLSGKAREAAQDTLKILNQSKNALEAAAKAAERSKNNLEGMGFALNQMSSSGIPAMNELSGVITKAAEGGAGLTLAFAALGAALGKAAYDLGFIGDKIGTLAKYDQQIGDLTTKIDIFNDKLRLGMVGPGGKNFVAAEAINNFNNQIANMAMEFQAASKTALFGNQLGGVGYGAAQLQMAGISAETIASSMKDVASVMGSNVSAKFGADIAILAARTGQSSENIASISDTFMRLDGVSKETAINMQEGMRAMATQANINLGALMEDVAEASKNALSYQIKSGPALAKAAAFANSIGVKFTSIAEAGKNMVLNYKDSIKAEMSLSAMLGRRVDLSQVRALFAAGRTEDAVRALKTQGLNPANMNMFQQQQLSQALGGANLDDLQKIATRTGRTGQLGKGDVGTQNQVFLSAKSSAESAKAVASAVQAAMTAIQNRELENQYNKAKNQALIDNTDGIADLTNQLKRKELEKSIMSSGTVYALAGAAVMALLTRGKGLGGLMKGAPAATGGISTMTGGANSGLRMVKGGLVHNAQGKFVSRAQADAFKASQGWVQAKSGVYYKPGSPQANAIMAARGGMTGGVAPTTGFKTNFTSGARGSFRGGAGMLSLITSAYDYKQRKDAGQTTLQAGAGAVTGGIGSIAFGAAGGAAAMAAGAAAGSVIPVVGTIIGGMLGYYLGSSLADNMTGANEQVVDAQELTSETVEMSNAEIAQEIRKGNLLDPMEYTVALQERMVEIMGLQAEYLNNIAESNTVFSVNMDSKKVLSLLNSRSNKTYGVTRVTQVNRTVK